MIKINSSCRLNAQYNSFSFKSGQAKNKKINNIIEKRNYIDAKTKNMDDLCLLSALGTMISGIFNLDLAAKEQKQSKFTIAMLGLTLALVLANSIKKMQLSKEYDKGIKYDSKNNA